MNKTELAIVEHVAMLNEAHQEQVLAYVEQLEQSMMRPAAGADVVALVRELDFDPEEVDTMAKAIDEACEQIEPDDSISL